MNGENQSACRAQIHEIDARVFVWLSWNSAQIASQTDSIEQNQSLY